MRPSGSASRRKIPTAEPLDDITAAEEAAWGARETLRLLRVVPCLPAPDEDSGLTDGTEAPEVTTPSEGAQSGRPVSFIRVHPRPPCVLLVRIEPTEEPEELALGELFAQVLRVRHALPACHRIRITRPLVVVVGPTVRERDQVLLEEAAREVDAEVLKLGPLVARNRLGAWLRHAMKDVSERRAQAAKVTETGV